MQVCILSRKQIEHTYANQYWRNPTKSYIAISVHCQVIVKVIWRSIWKSCKFVKMLPMSAGVRLWGGAWWCTWKSFTCSRRCCWSRWGWDSPYDPGSCLDLGTTWWKQIFDTMPSKKGKLPFVLPCEWVWFQHMRLHTWRGFKILQKIWREKNPHRTFQQTT